MTKAKSKPATPPGPEVSLVDLSTTYQDMLNVELIHPNKHNCNVMPKEQFKAMKSDMEAMAGPDGMEPILVRTTSTGFEIVNGEHRWRAAKELGWVVIKANIFAQEDITEDQALALNFRINNQRGNHDPKREARYFKHMLDKGVTQETLAKMVGLDRTTISHRLNILNISDNLLKDVAKDNPDTEIPVSVLELAGKLPTPELQKALIQENYIDYGEPVSELESVVKEMQEKHKEHQRFLAEKPNFKYPKCPDCRAEPSGWHWQPGKVECSKHSWHSWDPYKRKAEKKKETTTASAPVKKEPVVQSTFRTEHDAEEIRKAAIRFVLDYFKENIGIIEAIDIKVKGGGWGGSTEVRYTGMTLTVQLHTKEGRFSITGEKKTYTSAALKNMKMAIRVNDPAPTLKKGPSEGEKFFKKLLNGTLKPKPGKKKKK